jgi:uncharacterized protein (DUF58 family)
MLRWALLQNFKLLHRLDRLVGRRFTPVGLLVLSACFAGAVFGLDVRSTLGIQIASFSFALLLVAMVSALFFRAKIGVTRQLPSLATVGEPVTYVVTLKNFRASMQRGLLVKERLSQRLPTYDEFMATTQLDRRRNLFDRQVGYPRWAWLVRQGRGASAEESSLDVLPASGEARVELTLTAHRRGRIHLEAIDVSRLDPFGLFRAINKTGKAQSILVLPKRFPVTWRESLSSHRDRVGGDSAAMVAGNSDEFSRVREYRPGDPMHHIHWPSWARTGQPIVKVFQRRSFVRQALVLDTFSVSSSNEQFEEAVSVAASFAYRSDGTSTAVELCFVTDHTNFVGERADSTAMLEALAGVTACTRHEFCALSELVTRRLAHLSSCVCVFLAWDEPRQFLVKHLRSVGIPVAVFVVYPGSAPLFDPGPLADQPQRLCLIERGGAERALMNFDPESVAW